MDLNLVAQLAQSDHIAFKRHTLLRMHQRVISADEVKEALSKPVLVEDYPDDNPLPSVLVLGYTLKGRPIHAVIAMEEKEPLVWVITVYEPAVDQWEKDFLKRKKP